VRRRERGCPRAGSDDVLRPPRGVLRRRPLLACVSVHPCEGRTGACQQDFWLGVDKVCGLTFCRFFLVRDAANKPAHTRANVKPPIQTVPSSSSWRNEQEGSSQALSEHRYKADPSRLAENGRIWMKPSTSFTKRMARSGSATATAATHNGAKVDADQPLLESAPLGCGVASRHGGAPLRIVTLSYTPQGATTIRRLRCLGLALHGPGADAFEPAPPALEAGGPQWAPSPQPAPTFTRWGEHGGCAVRGFHRSDRHCACRAPPARGNWGSACHSGTRSTRTS
jgi:hypothetical protein